MQVSGFCDKGGYACSFENCTVVMLIEDATKTCIPKSKKLFDDFNEDDDFYDGVQVGDLFVETISMERA